MKIASAIITLSIAGAVSSAKASVFERLSKYDRTQLTVCFSSNPGVDLTREVALNSVTGEKYAPFPNSLKARVQEAVTSSFTQLGTGIFFTGFRDCRPEDRPDAVLFYSLSGGFSGLASGGSVGDPIKSANPRRRKTINSVIIRADGMNEIHEFSHPTSPLDSEIKREIDAWNQDRVMRLIVHEFGHIAGLRHEFDRTDGNELISALDLSPDDHMASFIFEKQQEDLAEERNGEFHPSESVGSPDPFSLMGYSWMDLDEKMMKLRIDCKIGYWDSWLKDFPEMRNFCDPGKLASLLGQKGEFGYFSAGDAATLRHYYLGIPLPRDRTTNQKPLIDWLKTVKTISKAHLGRGSWY